MSSVPLWPRPRFDEGGPDARVAFFAFAETPIEGDLDVSPLDHGIPEGASTEGLDLAGIATSEQPDWARGFFEDALLLAMQLDLGWKEPPLERVRHVHVLKGDVSDPSDLGYLQASWAIVRALCDAGAFVVLDAYPIRWYTAESVLAQDVRAPLDLEREITVVFETDATPEYGHIAHTRGMAKFGRPELVLPGCEESGALDAGRLLMAIAEPLVQGVRLYPGDHVRADEGPELELAGYEPGKNAPELHLQNDAFVIVRPV